MKGCRHLPRRASRIALIGSAVMGVAALVLPWALHLRVRVVYNASDSVPRGWYRIEPAESLRVGDVVLANLPHMAAALAAQRGYLPLGVPLLKPVAAIAPQHVCGDGYVIRIDGRPAAVARVADSHGRPLPQWRQCRALADEVYLLSTSHASSFDSRYFGPVSASEVIGVAQPIWTFREALEPNEEREGKIKGTARGFPGVQPACGFEAARGRRLAVPHDWS